jgi:hypothetical protein
VQHGRREFKTRRFLASPADFKNVLPLTWEQKGKMIWYLEAGPICDAAYTKLMNARAQRNLSRETEPDDSVDDDTGGGDINDSMDVHVSDESDAEDEADTGSSHGSQYLFRHTPQFI